MSNNLKMAKINAIIGLLAHGWSCRRIERELGVRRETVSKYKRLQIESESKPAKVTPGSDGAVALIFGPVRTTATSRSQCEPYQETIEAKLERELSAKRIFQDLVAEHGFSGSYSSVKRFVRKLDKNIPLPVRRMECEPGKEAQVDFGSGAWVIEEGKKRRPHVLRVTLSNSRKSYSEVVWKQTTENFIRCIENAFRSFGGVTKTLVIDNLKAAVKNVDLFDPDLNPKVLEFARHYGFVIMPTKPYTPEHKGKVESGIKYVKNNCAFH